MEDLQHFYKNTNYFTHNFHPYPHKCTPQVARKLIQTFSAKDEMVLDPFCGSGTVLIEAQLTHRRAVGVDLNPLACLISRVKTRRYDLHTLQKTIAALLQKIFANVHRQNNLNDFFTKQLLILPKIPQAEKWFQKEALSGLSIVKGLIEEIGDHDIRDFGLVAFSSTVKKVSNASSLYRLTPVKKRKKVSQIEVYRQFRKKLRNMMFSLQSYETNTQRINPLDPKRNKHLELQRSEDLKPHKNEYLKPPTTRQRDSKRQRFEEQKSAASIRILNRDARHLWELPQVDLIITNPPSFSLDFPRCFGIYFWWLQFGCLKKLDRTLIGTKKVNGKKEILQIPPTDEIINHIQQKKNHRGVAVSKYYYDMRLVFAHLHRVLKENKYLCVLVSDCTVEGYRIRAPETFISLAEQAGFTLQKRMQRIVPKKAFIFATEDKVEEILVLKKLAAP